MVESREPVNMQPLEATASASTPAQCCERSHISSDRLINVAVWMLACVGLASKCAWSVQCPLPHCLSVFAPYLWSVRLPEDNRQLSLTFTCILTAIGTSIHHQGAFPENLGDPN